jgi:plastocyanin
MANHAGGISIMAFVVAIAVSMGYYQFMYIPQANAKPILPEIVLNPPDNTKISIAEGASLPTNGKFFVPKDVRGVIGVSNHIVWTNTDTTAHTVTSDTDFVDRVNGPFDSLKQQVSIPGGYLLPGKTFEFTFTAVGDYAYHCVPHPHMQGKVEIVENFS